MSELKKVAEALYDNIDNPAVIYSIWKSSSGLILAALAAADSLLQSKQGETDGKDPMELRRDKRSS